MSNPDILTLNYYALFEVSPTPFVDAIPLLEAYHRLARQYHPDAVTPTAATQAARVMAHVNAAYMTLKDPLKSAGYWLAQQALAPRGGDLDLQFDLRQQLESLQTKEALEQFLAHVTTILQLLPKRFIEGVEHSLEKASAILSDWHFYDKLKTDAQQKRSTCLWFN